MLSSPLNVKTLVCSFLAQVNDTDYRDYFTKVRFSIDNASHLL